MSRSLAITALAATATAECSREFLKARGADYLAAQLTGKPSAFTQHAAPNFTYVENNIVLSPNRYT